jgi:hypothetical protein
MPTGRQFDVAEKTKVAPKDIAARLNRDVSTVRKVIRDNKKLPVEATPPPAKKSMVIQAFRHPKRRRDSTVSFTVSCLRRPGRSTRRLLALPTFL